MFQLLVAGGLTGTLLFSSCHPQASPTAALNASMMNNTQYENLDTATFGTGCFWCTEAVFQELKGVHKVTSGYSGGHVKNPTYEQVCAKTTGHAEVIQMVYDPAVISFDELLEVFWKVHDPTTPNQQGADIGPQYRSAIFYHNDAQKTLAEKYKKELDASGAFAKKIVTEISPLKNFYAAEDYHQKFYNNNPSNGYCSYVIKPKLDKFTKVFKDKLRKS
ncbi:MAG: peptide-methionine (S)-S-oxide reductase [Bacteroidetes bacterium]|nr:MAG: peptide-methionine (S)-S-oxide reductase [Bacteroidota bacterium]